MFSFKVTRKTFHYFKVCTPRFKGFSLSECLNICYFIKDIKTDMAMPLLNHIKKHFLEGCLFDYCIIKDLTTELLLNNAQLK